MSENVKRFEATLRDFGEVNEGFIRATVNICSKDQIANSFLFTRESIEKSRSKWAYLPIKGEFCKEVGDFKGHGGKLEITDDGIEFIKTTVPMGVVIANTDRFEMVKSLNGESKEYLCVDVYLWAKEFEEEMIAFKNGENRNQSMEIMIDESTYDYDRGIDTVHAFSPLALCILGKDVTPAFTDSRVKVQFESGEFKAKYDEMVMALDKLMKFEEQKGGCDVTEEIKVDEVVKEETIETAVEEEVSEETIDTQEVEQENEEVAIADGETDTAEEFKNDKKEDDEEDEELAKKKKKCSEEVDYQALHSELQVAFNDLKANYDDLQIQYNQINEEVGGLREFKSNVEAMENEARLEAERVAKKEMIDSFSELTDDEKSEIVDSVDHFSLEEIETKLSIAFARKLKNAKQSKVEEPKTFANLDSEQRPSAIDALLAEVEKYKKY